MKYMNKQESDILNVLLIEPFINQRILAEVSGHSLGVVNRSLKELIKLEYIDDSIRPTVKAITEFKQKTPQRAVILAAGFGMRMVPINTEMPKGLLEVNGEALIERIIKQLHEVGIKEIYVVVGFMKEKYEYLIDEYGVELVVNADYAVKNNLHSVKLVKEHLENAYIIPCDIWCDRNPFHRHELYSWYMVSDLVDNESNVRVNRKMELVTVPESYGGNAMIGICYLVKEDADTVAERIEKLCENQRYDGAFWEEALYNKDRMIVAARVVHSADVVEINTYEQLREITYNDPYRSLKRLAMIRLKNYTNKHYEVADRYSCKLLEETDENILMKLLSEDTEKRIPAKFQVVCANTQKIIRMVLNTIYSFLFSVEISDHPVLAKKSKKALTYGELRILSFLRNPLFTVEEFRKREIKLDDRQNKDTVDYSIMMVMEIFYSFVKDPVSIDKLIITHKYTCDVWKNGSKYLYFYTLHNQEHAIDLIKNIVKLVHAIDFINISAVDYYILFLACYLHDISMVKIPSYDSFLIDMNQTDELAKELLDDLNKELFSKDQEGKSEEEKNQSEKNLEEDPDILIVKKYMLESYKKVDNYFEKAVRGRHAVDSAAEIRNRTEIKYLDTTMRELVAEVSEAHCADERNIYGAKSNATSQLISIKYDKILLRLADLLDMSSYRVSKPILHHNIEQMSEESAFHWISHLLTQKYELHSKYEISDPEDEKSILAPQTITENIVLEIPVDLSQMSALECNNPCQKIKIDRKNILPQEITLTCGEKCEDDSEGDVNSERRCNFLCQWFCVKNDYLIKELAALKEYLNRNTNNYFKSEIQIKIKCNGKTNIDARQFEILTDYIQNKKH